MSVEGQNLTLSQTEDDDGPASVPFIAFRRRATSGRLDHITDLKILPASTTSPSIPPLLPDGYEYVKSALFDRESVISDSDDNQQENTGISYEGKKTLILTSQ